MAGFVLSSLTFRSNQARRCNSYALSRLLRRHIEGETRAHVQAAIRFAVVDARMLLHERQHRRHGWQGVDAVSEFRAMTHDLAPAMACDVRAVMRLYA